MKVLMPLILLLAAGCSGGMLKELPVLDAPTSDIGTESATLVGAWESTDARGPGSASLRRIFMVFDAEGRFSAAAFGGPRPSTLAGTYRSLEGAVEVELGDLGRRVWGAEFENDSLILREGEGELHLERIR